MRTAYFLIPKCLHNKGNGYAKKIYNFISLDQIIGTASITIKCVKLMHIYLNLVSNNSTLVNLNMGILTSKCLKDHDFL